MVARVSAIVQVPIDRTTDLTLRASFYGRAARGNFKAVLDAETIVAAGMNGLASDAEEIGYDLSAAMPRASNTEPEAAFERMNSRW